VKGDFEHIVVLEELYQDLRRRSRLNQDHQLEDDSDSADAMDGQESNEKVTIPNGEMEGLAIEVEPSSTMPLVDEDGFQLVQGRGRRRH
jgi:hypothetical protein